MIRLRQPRDPVNIHRQFGSRTYLLSHGETQEERVILEYLLNGRFIFIESFLCKASWQVAQYYLSQRQITQAMTRLDTLVDKYHHLEEQPQLKPQLVLQSQDDLILVAELARIIARISRLYNAAQDNLKNYETVIEEDMNRLPPALVPEFTELRQMMVQIKTDNDLRHETLESAQLYLQTISARLEKEQAQREKERDLIFVIIGTLLGLVELFSTELGEVAPLYRVLAVVLLFGFSWFWYKNKIKGEKR